MHVMLDLETMGIHGQSPIIAIGAVVFDETGVYEKFYTQVQLESNLSVGLRPDASTILWWLEQSDNARGAFRNNEIAPTLSEALSNFAEWFHDVGGEQVWGNGAVSDNGILGNAYRAVGIAQPWKFWNDRCYRTIKSLYPHMTLERVGTHHNALDDAESQARHLSKIALEHGFALQ